MPTSINITQTGGGGGATVSVERALANDARLAYTVLNELRYPALGRAFGIPREQANLLTFVLALSAAGATYDALARFIRHPWPFDRADTEIGVFLMREAGFGIAGPKAREVKFFGVLIAVTAIGGLTVPSLRRAIHSARLAAERIGEQRRRVYGVAQQRADQLRDAADQVREAAARVTPFGQDDEASETNGGAVPADQPQDDAAV
jgi:hypothetical protein